MAEVVQEGLALHIGVSNFDRPLIERCLPIHPVTSVQNQFSLIHQDDRAELLPWLAEQGIWYLAYGPLAFGLLTGAIGPDTAFPRGDWRGRQRAGSPSEGDGPFSPGNFERNLERVDRLRSIADGLGIPVSTLALAWTFHQIGVTAAIAGSRDPAHVRSNAAAGDVTLDAPTLQVIDSIFESE
jgi:aryl-alcohol dehydrogenase-like predicted oxidoreductase